MRQRSPLGWRASYHEGMPPRARAKSRKASGPTALTDADVALLRERLETGKRPRVMLLVDTALGAAGTSVPVVGFADPAVGEFISIRLRDDVVPFSPAELSLPVRGAKATPAEPSGAPAALPLEPPAPARPSHPSEGYRPSGADVQAASKASAPSGQSRPARLVAVPEPEAAEPSEPAGTEKPTKAAKKKPTRAGAMSVTMRFNGQTWSYESTRGGKRSTGRPLTLAAVRAFADRLDDPPLRRELLNAINVCRQQVQTRAEALRAELERVEVELAELDE
jgi:hypothetical protein